MAFAPPSVAGDYRLVSQYDPALETPHRLEDESDEAWKERWEAWEHKLGVARDTGVWDPLLKPGQQPTYFRVRQIPGPVFRTLDRVILPLAMAERCALIVRVALVGIENGPPNHELERGEHVDEMLRVTGLGQVVTEKTIALLDSVPLPADFGGEPVRAGALVNELGLVIHDRRSRLPGK